MIYEIYLWKSLVKYLDNTSIMLTTRTCLSKLLLILIIKITFSHIKEEEMRKSLLAMIFAMCFILGSSAQLVAQDYDFEAKAKNMSFSWKVDGSDLKVKLSGKTTGWIGIGFNPSTQMKDADFVLGYVKDGKAKIIDEFGDSERTHKQDEKLGGSNNVTLVGGSEESGVTTIEFSIPLKSGDKTDTAIDPAGETIVLLAYGGKRDSFKSKHKYRTTIKVNLSSGKVE